MFEELYGSFDSNGNSNLDGRIVSAQSSRPSWSLSLPNSSDSMEMGGNNSTAINQIGNAKSVVTTVTHLHGISEEEFKL